MNHFSPQLQDTLKTLSHCHDMCLSMAVHHCLALGGAHAAPGHIGLMLDCESICAFAHDAILRKSQYHGNILYLCADICETCGKACEALGQMDDCVAACRECADACRKAARLDPNDTLTAAERVRPG